MNDLPALNCDVCGKPSIGVASSSMGAISFAYCGECARLGREPYGALVGGLMGAGSDPDGWAVWARPIVDVSLAFAGKTLADLCRDIKQAEAEFDAYMNNEGP